MSPAPGATAEDSKTAGGLLGPDTPLPFTFAFHPPHTHLIPSTVFPFTGCTASTQGILPTGAFHKFDDRNAVVRHTVSSDEAAEGSLLETHHSNPR